MTDKQEREYRHIDPKRSVSSLSRKELAHLSSCRFCRQQIALQAEKQELLAAPARMKAEILSQLNRPEIQIIEKTNRFSKKLELFYFSLRVGTAVLCSLALLSFAPALPGPVQSPETVWKENKISVWEASSNFTEQLNRLLNLEVFKYDKKER